MHQCQSFVQPIVIVGRRDYRCQSRNYAANRAHRNCRQSSVALTQFHIIRFNSVHIHEHEHQSTGIQSTVTQSAAKNVRNITRRPSKSDQFRSIHAITIVGYIFEVVQTHRRINGPKFTVQSLSLPEPERKQFDSGAGKQVHILDSKTVGQTGLQPIAAPTIQLGQRGWCGRQSPTTSTIDTKQSGHSAARCCGVTGESDKFQNRTFAETAFGQFGHWFGENWRDPIVADIVDEQSSSWRWRNVAPDTGQWVWFAVIA